MARFKLADRTITLPGTGVSYRITLPDAFDPLLEASASDPEGHLPYWAMIWPSGIALADAILTAPEHFARQRVLELGCGLGITAIAAVATGARLVVTDYAPDALLLSRLNALENTGREPYALQVNWRQPRAALLELAGEPFRHVLAADVLYEARDVEPLLDLMELLVARDGTLWLAEPGRPAARQFLQAAAARGWQDEATERRGPWPGQEEAGVVVGVHQLRRGA